MQLFVAQRADMREEELEDVKQFKKTTISCYLRCLDGRSCWTTLIRSGHTHGQTHTHTHGHPHTHTDTLICWGDLNVGSAVPLSAFRVLLENDEDRLLVVFNRGLILMTEVGPGNKMMFNFSRRCLTSHFMLFSVFFNKNKTSVAEVNIDAVKWRLRENVRSSLTLSGC